MQRLAIVLAALAAVLAAATRQSAAQPAQSVTATWAYTPTGGLALDGGLVVGAPAALPTGMSRGLGAGIAWGRNLVLGARASWSTATESTLAWTVTHRDTRLRATAAVQHVAGRGAIGLRLGAGGTLVHERRRRNQGERAGLMGDALETRALALVPAADLDAVVTVHVAGPWAVAMSGGPSVAIVDGEARAAWTAQVGVAWYR